MPYLELWNVEHGEHATAQVGLLAVLLLHAVPAQVGDVAVTHDCRREQR